MDRARALVAIALVLGVIILGTIAGGLSNEGASDAEKSPGVGLGSGNGSGIGDGGGAGLRTSNATTSPFPAWIGLAPFLLTLWLIVIAGVGAIVVFLWRASVDELVAALVSALGRFAMLAALLAGLFAFLLLLSALLGAGGGGFVGGNPVTGEPLTGESTTADSPALTTGLAILAGVALLGVALLVVFSSGDDNDETTVEGKPLSESTTAPEPGGLEPAARLADPDASNEVFRAWTALRDRVSPRDGAASPAEIRRRALDAGLEEAAVDELTALFNAVRYGERGATTERERRARALRERLDGEPGSEDAVEGKR